MSLNGRYSAAEPTHIAEGWLLQRLTPPSRLFGAHGMRCGADGRIYVAQVTGSQISAIDVKTGGVETISPLGGDIVGPDDLDFDSRGNLYATEPMDARVSVRDTAGRTRVLRDDLPDANGIAFFQDRLFVDESRVNGRLMEIDLNGGTPKVLLENLPLPNALAPGPDGLLYFPLIGANEIWRIHPDGGPGEKVIGGLHHPVAVKFDAKGFIVSPQSSSGEVLRIDPRNGSSTVLANLDPGLDNIVFMGERLFASQMQDGRITEVLAGGHTKQLLPAGFHWPLGITVGDDGLPYVADGFAFYVLHKDGRLQCLQKVHDKGSPHGMRGVTAAGARNFIVTTWDGKIAHYRPWEKEYDVIAEGLDELYGVALAPSGAAVAAEYGAGRVVYAKSGSVAVLATGLHGPKDVAVTADGACLVSESAAGRIVKIAGNRVETVVDGLMEPHGIAVEGDTLYIADAKAQQVIAYDLPSRTRRVVAANLPIGAPPGVVPKRLRGVRWFCGPMGPFAGLDVAADGTIYLSADADGSLLALRPR
jgi:sugar lactone lactonase YvrE